MFADSAPEATYSSDMLPLLVNSPDYSPFYIQRTPRLWYALTPVPVYFWLSHLETGYSTFRVPVWD